MIKYKWLILSRYVDLFLTTCKDLNVPAQLGSYDGYGSFDITFYIDTNEDYYAFMRLWMETKIAFDNKHRLNGTYI